MATYLNHVAIAYPANGTNSSASDPSSAGTGTVVAGAMFTPTAGRRLLLLFEGAITATTPTGWTLPTGGSAIGNTGLYVFTRTAAGSDTITSTHNGSNYRRVWHWIEFASGSTFVTAASATGVASGAAGPTLSGLTGTNNLFGVAGGGVNSGANGDGVASWSAGTLLTTATTTTPDVLDGYFYSITQVVDSASTTASFTPTVTGFAIPADFERLVFAVQGAVSGDAAVTAVRGTATAAGRVPTVTGSGSAATVTAVRAQAAAAAQEPAVDVVVTLTGGGPAAGTALARPPAVSAVSTGSVTGTVATGVAAAGVPVVSAAVLATVTGVRATAAATAPVPAVTGTSVGAVNAVRATASATSNPPGVILAETLPSNVGTGRITGRFAEAKVLVGDADGIPNLYPFTTETVTFTSTAPILLDTTATPAPVVIIPRPIVCTLDSLGYLVDSAGHQYVDLIATNDPDLTPTTRKWRAVFSAGLGIATFDFVVLSGATKDLTAEIPT